MFRNILVAIDGSTTSNRGLKTAIELAADQDAKLSLVHVIDNMIATPGLEGGYMPPRYMDDIIENLRQSGRKVLDKAQSQARAGGVEAAVILVEVTAGGVAQAILREARRLHADVIVLGTHGRRGMRRMLLGSDAETVVREATVPVLLVRTPESTESKQADTPEGSGAKSAKSAEGAKVTKSAQGANAATSAKAAKGGAAPKGSASSPGKVGARSRANHR